MSAKLSCNASKCVNNINGLCVANNIRVEGIQADTSSKTSCENFASKGFINAMSNFTNMNLVGEFKQLFSNDSIEMSPEIECEAEKCVYNVNKICGASNVQICGEVAETTSDTQCETFREG